MRTAASLNNLGCYGASPSIHPAPSRQLSPRRFTNLPPTLRGEQRQHPITRNTVVNRRFSGQDHRLQASCLTVHTLVANSTLPRDIRTKAVVGRCLEMCLWHGGRPLPKSSSTEIGWFCGCVGILSSGSCVPIRMFNSHLMFLLILLRSQRCLWICFFRHAFSGHPTSKKHLPQTSSCMTSCKSRQRCARKSPSNALKEGIIKDMIRVRFKIFLSSSTTMTPYQLTSSIRSPGRSTTFMEFSPNGRFLAIGDRDLSSLFVLDNRTGYYPNLSVTTPAEPTALAWDTTETFYVGLSDGHFIHYRINLENNELIKGVVNNFFYGGFPATAIALNKDSHILAISVGPEVFVFQRVRTTSECFCNHIVSMNSFHPSQILFCCQRLEPIQLQTRPWDSIPIPKVDLFHRR